MQSYVREYYQGLLDIGIAKKKLELRQSPEQIDDESLQVLDVISAIIMILPETESKGKVLIPGENTFYTDVCGEQVCQASKEIIKNNKRFGIFKNNDKVESYGRKIDLIVAGKVLQLSTNEWKKSDCTDRVALKQQSKNVRMNKAVITSLEQIEVPKDDQKYIFTLAMDWRGNAGYLFYVSKFDDAYVAKETHTLGIPSTLNELVTFYDKLDALYIWKHHNQRLVNIIESSLERCKGQESVERIITTNFYEDDKNDSDGEGNRILTYHLVWKMMESLKNR
ncbi:hypothetical protein INT45_000383 [Circinella minor]|uniref:Uncharacterized protein n=1 Tax=Circinella minor TaxID=1195481 RepID=A0A8H7VII5_9FUNG|nr:hypothetical protein INT45_000383 [Circinella minor]